MLKRMAEATGGRYFRARNSDELADVYRTIDQLEPVADTKQSLRPVDELYWMPLAASVAATALAFLLPGWRMRALRRWRFARGQTHERAFADFHFLRPLWLLLLLAAPAFWLLRHRGRADAGAWRNAIDPHLLPHLIERIDAGSGTRRHRARARVVDARLRRARRSRVGTRADAALSKPGRARARARARRRR